MHIPARRRFLSLTLVACAAGLATACACAQDVAQNVEQDDERAHGVAYGGAPRQKLDVYAPGNRTTGTQPVVVYFYGGSWQGGDRADARGVAEALAGHGIVTIAPDYRVYPETIFPGFIDDAAAAVRWARDHARDFGGDPGRIIVMGHSAGAHIAAMLATDPRYLAAHGMAKSDLRGMIGLAGPYAAIPPGEPHMADIFPVTSRGRTLPIDFISGDEPPMLLATGSADTVVDPANSVRFADALRAYDDIVELKTYAGYDHVRIVDEISAAQREASPVFADVAGFIDAH